jgi:two-component system NtrC family sensor kinase
MKTFRLTLFKKFAIAATVIVIAFGVTNLYFLWYSGYKSFEHEIEKRSKVLSKIIAERVLQPIVYDDYVNVYKVLDQVKSNDPSVAYIFILDENNKIIAQTYDLRIPFSLIQANKAENNSHNIKVIKTKNFEHDIIRDIAYPILNGEIGTVRLGLIEEDIRKELNDASRTMSLMVISFLVIGLVLAFFFSFLITLPIKRITQKAQNLDLNSISMAEIEEKPLRFRTFFNFYFSDELDILIAKFSEMIDRLKNNIIELRATRNSFIQAEKLASIGTLTAGISHEINNPLAGIKNAMNRIEKEPENIQQNIKYIELIKDAISKMEGVVKPLLSFSRKSDISITKVPIQSIIENALQLADYKTKKANIQIEKQIQANCEIHISVNHMEQVLINLILNGVDAIQDRIDADPTHQGKITIFVCNKDGVFSLKVKDNGIGISEKNQNKIFDPFFTSKELGKGTGLGLYVSYNIIKDLGGKLSFKSEENEGTEFLIELPN